MDFLELQQRLTVAGHDPFRVYAGHYDDLRGASHDVARSGWICHGAWNMLIEDGRYTVTVRELHRPTVYPPDLHGPEPMTCPFSPPLWRSERNVAATRCSSTSAHRSRRCSVGTYGSSSDASTNR